MASRAPLPTPRLMGELAAAAYLGRGRTRFREEWKSGRLPAPSDRNGKVPLWDVKVLDRFVDAKSGLGPQTNSWGDEV